MKYLLIPIFILLTGLISKHYLKYIKLTKSIKSYCISINSLKEIKSELNSPVINKIFDDISRNGIILLIKLVFFMVPYFVLFYIFYLIGIKGFFLYIFPGIHYLFVKRYI